MKFFWSEISISLALVSQPVAELRATRPEMRVFFWRTVKHLMDSGNVFGGTNGFRWMDGLLNNFEHRIANAVSDSFSSRIQSLKTNVRKLSLL
jgi:hypothetical protein